MSLQLECASITLDKEGGVVLVLLCCTQFLDTDYSVEIYEPNSVCVCVCVYVIRTARVHMPRGGGWKEGQRLEYYQKLMVYIT